MELTPTDLRFLRLLIHGRGGRAKHVMVHELAVALGVSEGAVRARASKLRDLGLIESPRTAGFVFYTVNERGRKACR